MRDSIDESEIAEPVVDLVSVSMMDGEAIRYFSVIRLPNDVVLHPEPPFVSDSSVTLLSNVTVSPWSAALRTSLTHRVILSHSVKLCLVRPVPARGD